MTKTHTGNITVKHYVTVKYFKSGVRTHKWNIATQTLHYGSKLKIALEIKDVQFFRRILLNIKVQSSKFKGANDWTKGQLSFFEIIQL